MVGKRLELHKDGDTHFGTIDMDCNNFSRNAGWVGEKGLEWYKKLISKIINGRKPKTRVKRRVKK